MEKWFKFLSILAEAYICGEGDTDDIDYVWHVINTALGDLAEIALEQPWVSKTGRAEYIQSFEVPAALATARRGILMYLTTEVIRAHREVGWVKFLWEDDQVGPFVSWILEGGITSVD